MTQQEVLTLAAELMYKFDLYQHGWRFKFDNSVKRFGVCRYRRKIIGISIPLSSINGIDQVKDTILHEIAHAIAGNSAGHGQRWKDVCIAIGAKPERCYDSHSIETPTLRYYAICGGCGKEWQRAKKVDENRKRSCGCQRGIDWSQRKLLKFIDRRA